MHVIDMVTDDSQCCSTPVSVHCTHVSSAGIGRVDTLVIMYSLDVNMYTVSSILLYTLLSSWFGRLSRLHTTY